MQRSCPGINPDITQWKGQEIVNFQEELRQKVNAHISEKWFYTHIKSDSGKLPRIDILNLLSNYAGYSSWDDFKIRQSETSSTEKSLKKTNKYFIYVPALVILSVGILYLLFIVSSTRDYQFHFYDADTAEPINNQLIKVTVLLDNESPVSYTSDTSAVFAYTTSKANIRFVVESSLYENDTIFRVLNKYNPVEVVRLKPDNYAMMIQYFSQRNVKDWQQRRNQLNRIISDSAIIYQVIRKGDLGVELFSKKEFIDKLTLPTTGLRNIEILDTKYDGKQIAIIRFRQKEVVK